MELLNVGFAILLIKITISILPGVVGVFLVGMSGEKRREFRNSFCSKVFGLSNAIPYPKFERTMKVIGIVMILFTLVASWFLLLSDLFEA